AQCRLPDCPGQEAAYFPLRQGGAEARAQAYRPLCRRSPGPPHAHDQGRIPEPDERDGPRIARHMPGAGFADIQAQIWDWFQEGKKKEARDLFAKMLMMAVLEQ